MTSSFSAFRRAVIRVLNGVYGLTASVVSSGGAVLDGLKSVLISGKPLIVRQAGGVANVDEGQIYHVGTSLFLVDMNGTGTAGIVTVVGRDGAAGTLQAGRIDVGASSDTYISRLVANVASMPSGDWFQQTAGRSRVTADVTNATAAMAAITGLSATLIAARVYTGRMAIKCSETVAAEGIRVDFNGGAATMTSFAAAARILTGGTTVVVNEVSSALDTDFDWSTITGETWIIFEITMVVNGAGTFIPRFSQTADLGGTVTVSLGSYMWLEDMP